jgi:hypothetical protein
MCQRSDLDGNSPQDLKPHLCYWRRERYRHLVAVVGLAAAYW